MSEQTKITLAIPKELREKAKKKAKKEDTSVSRKLREVLRAWVEEDPPEKD